MKQKIYNYSPYFVKFILVNIKAYINKKKRYNEFYKPIYDKLLENSVSKREVVLKYQKKQLIKLLTECFLYSKYYRKKFDNLSISLEDINNNPYKVISKLPILSKEVRKSNSEEIKNNNPSRSIIEISFTSGTTGTPTINYIDKETYAYSFALWDRFHHKIGIKKGYKSVRLSYNKIIHSQSFLNRFWIYNFIDKQLLFSVYHLIDKNLKYYVDKLNNFKPLYIDGSPSAIYILANYIKENNLNIDFNLIAICTTAETLFDYQREEIEKVFKCKVYNQYASSEGSPFITECRNGMLHLEEDSGYFEILNEENVQIENGVGKLVVTSLRNWKTPLIRYDILDYVEIDNNLPKCNCGSPFRTVNAIAGRANDLFWHPSKGFIRANVSYVIKDFVNIKKMKVIQINPDNIDVYIELFDKKSSDIQNLENAIKKNLKETIYQKIEVNFIYNNFPVNNKKSRFIIRDFNIEDFK